MKASLRILFPVLILIMILGASCNKNYYSGSRKGSNCGCPSNPR